MTKSTIERARARSQVRARSRALAAFESEFDDLLAKMETLKVKKAMKAFDASPAQLGRAAIARATKKTLARRPAVSPCVT